MIVIRHACKNRHCFAKEHLSIGTAKDNALDKRDHGTMLVGEMNSSAKISDEVALSIMKTKYPRTHPLYRTMRDRAEYFGVSLGIIETIDNRNGWKHLKNRLPDFDISHIDIPVTKHISRKRGRQGYDEKMVIDIIASRKHENDPEYLSQRQRAMKFGVSQCFVYDLDNDRSWRYLPRPRLVEYPKAGFEWNSETLQSAFERVKLKCKYDDFPNEFMNTPCLVWQHTLQYGRPVMLFKGKQQMAYRYACEYKENRLIKEGEIVRHLCGNEKCCEPSHLTFGTFKENSEDAIKHGRITTLKENDVIKIKELLLDGLMTKTAIAKMYNVSLSCIYAISVGRTWKYLNKIST
jgi:hypothetical protein